MLPRRPPSILSCRPAVFVCDSAGPRVRRVRFSGRNLPIRKAKSRIRETDNRTTRRGRTALVAHAHSQQRSPTPTFDQKRNPPDPKNKKNSPSNPAKNPPFHQLVRKNGPASAPPHGPVGGPICARKTRPPPTVSNAHAAPPRPSDPPRAKPRQTLPKRPKPPHTLSVQNKATCHSVPHPCAGVKRTPPPHNQNQDTPRPPRLHTLQCARPNPASSFACSTSFALFASQRLLLLRIPEPQYRRRGINGLVGSGLGPL